jgi:hypothetical protein
MSNKKGKYKLKGVETGLLQGREVTKERARGAD